MVTEPETTFGYAVVEKALMAVHGFVEQKRGAFRARLIHFQRLKVVPAAPGKGRRIAYRREDIFRWAVALEFAEFGIDPTEIKKMLDLNWPRIEHVVLGAKDGPDKYLCFNPNFLGRLSSERTVRDPTARACRITSRLQSFPTSLISIRKPAPTRRVLPSISSGLDME